MEAVSGTPASFKDFTALYKEMVYGKICEYLPDGEPEEHSKAVRTYVDRKGQYRRPSYLLLWTLLYNGDIKEAILPAAIQQVSEDWILIIDDWMDGNTLRRGQPAAQVIFGDRYAINAASNLQAVNWRMAKDAMVSLGTDRGNRYFEKFYDMIEVTHRGQYIDLNLTHDVKDITKFTLDDYYKSIFAKSAYYTVFGPMQQGAIIAGADQEKVAKIQEYGTPIGNAFQIKDDILDCTSTEDVLGKSIGNDVREGTKTLILWHAVNNAPTNVLARLKEIYSKKRGDKSDQDVKFVLDTFTELGSIDNAQKKADELTLTAQNKFDEIENDITESGIKELARESIGYVAKRSK